MVLGQLKEKADLVAETFNSLEGMSCNPVQGAMYAFPQIKMPQAAIEAAKVITNYLTFQVFTMIWIFKNSVFFIHSNNWMNKFWIGRQCTEDNALIGMYKDSSLYNCFNDICQTSIFTLQTHTPQPLWPPCAICSKALHYTCIKKWDSPASQLNQDISMSQCSLVTPTLM